MRSPDLKSDRICLRFLRKSDIPSLVHHVGHKSVSKYTLIPHPYSEKDGLEFLELSRKQRQAGVNYNLSIEDLATGDVIGGVGINSISKQHNNAEFGYWLSYEHRGKGIMSEAVRLAVRFFFREFKFERVHAHVDISNFPSIKVLERTGFTREGCLRRAFKTHGRYRDVYIYGMLRSEQNKLR